MKASSGPKENGLEAPLALSHGGLWPLPVPWRPGLPGQGCPALKARQGHGGCPGTGGHRCSQAPPRTAGADSTFSGLSPRGRRKEEVGGEKGGGGGGGEGRAERGFGETEEVRRGRRRWEPARPARGGESGVATLRSRPSPSREPHGPPSRACPLGSRQKAISELHRKCATLPGGRARAAGPDRGPSGASAEGDCQSPGALGERGPLSTSPAFEVTGMEVLN